MCFYLLGRAFDTWGVFVYGYTCAHQCTKRCGYTLFYIFAYVYVKQHGYIFYIYLYVHIVGQKTGLQLFI